MSSHPTGDATGEPGPPPPPDSLADTDLNETDNRDTGPGATPAPPTPEEAFADVTDSRLDRGATGRPEPDQVEGFDPAALDEDADGGYTSDAGSG